MDAHVPIKKLVIRLICITLAYVKKQKQKKKPKKKNKQKMFNIRQRELVYSIDVCQDKPY